jgi:transposase
VEHIGIDLGATHSHVVVMTPAGEVKSRRKVRTVQLPLWLGERAAGRVVMEACTQSPRIAQAAQAAGHATSVVPGQVVRALGVGARGIKTDDRDAEVLARASVRNDKLPSVHLRSKASCSRRELLAARAVLIKARTSITLNVKSWLRGRLIVLRGAASARTFGEVVRQLALRDSGGLPLAIEIMLSSFQELSTQIATLNKEIKKVVKTDPVCGNLQTVPGVGPLVSLAFATHIDEPQRFGSSDELASYLALVPGEATTGGKVVRTKTIRCGPQHLKALLVQSAWSMWRTRPDDPVVRWTRAIADKRGKRIAIVALARKIATIMWSMWKHGTVYDPMRAAAHSAGKTGQL